MGYTAVRGGLDAIGHAERLAEAMPLNSDHPLAIDQIDDHLALAVGRVMAEGGLADATLAALAIKQAEGDLIEAAFLLRAYRSTLPRLGYSHAVIGRDLLPRRRISSIFRDIPGGQLLGLTRDYTRRLLDFRLLDDDAPPPPTAEPAAAAEHQPDDLPNVIDFLRDEGLLDAAPARPADEEPFDITRTPASFPIPRSGWLQVLARGEAGALLMLAYASMRGHGGQGHGALAELRAGELPVRVAHPLTGRPVTLGHLPVTEAHYVSGGHASQQDADHADYRMGYGIVAGRDERKAIAMAIIDASLRWATPDDSSPVASQEFVVSHVDSVEAAGFVEHLKLPHYVTFQASRQRSQRFRELVEVSSRG